MHLIDTIILNNGRELRGVIDFIGKKQIYFYDFTDTNRVDLLTLMCLWKGNEPELRFSVWLLKNLGGAAQFRAKILNRKDIKSCDAELDETVINKARHRKIKIT